MSPELSARLNGRDAEVQALLAGLNQALAANRAIADNKGFAGVAVEAIL